mmetsp:Transcript_56240/g.93021  ORF Transcript_56240/g.93021 Transcript_56240/m.93021 type:complete len:165 (+) Transcript_56240:37-531(+)|eukprot:CAMPEP_0119312310 /NCGR_PEP_ID=MMETSP1333-20130426/25840_1 /TAXON_ID=418940 /ORGANISM="Scyphosphaera apsteinii, Strain RCC1455" /LENGTH=164 /DNA_ID=CAMNT_0007316911 /DNA_START=37 /DNA_END=531 /DNA_ORIENTATION=-
MVTNEEIKPDDTKTEKTELVEDKIKRWDYEKKTEPFRKYDSTLKADKYVMPNGQEIFKIQQYTANGTDTTSPVTFQIRPWVTCADSSKGSCWATMPEEAKVKLDGGFLLITNGNGETAGFKLPRSIDPEQEPVVQTEEKWIGGNNKELSRACLHITLRRKAGSV